MKKNWIKLVNGKARFMGGFRLMPREAIAFIPNGIDSADFQFLKAEKVDKIDDFGTAIKVWEITLDQVAKDNYLALEAVKAQDEADEKAADQVIIDAYKAIDIDAVSNLAEAKQVLKQMKRLLKVLFKTKLS